MSLSSKEDLLEKLIWGQQRYTLAELISEHSLPRIIRVKQGYEGGSDSTSLGYGEVLTLHALRKTRKLMAKDSNEHAIAIALECPYKLQILPSRMKCNLNTCRMENLPSLYPKTKYLQVLRTHYGTEPRDDSTRVGQLLEIMKVDKREKTAKVKNVETGKVFTLSRRCMAEFRPLQDWKTYHAKDIKNQCGFPIRVHFLVTEDEANSAHKFTPKVKDVTVVGETEEVLIVATTVGDNIESTFCYEIPKDLDVRVEIAQDFLDGDGDYEQVVTDLKNEFDVSEFINSQQAGFVTRYNSINEYDYESIRDYYNVPNKISHRASNQDDSSALPPSTFDHSPPLKLSSPNFAGDSTSSTGTQARLAKNDPNITSDRQTGNAWESKNSRPVSQTGVSTIPPEFRPANFYDDAAKADPNLLLRAPRLSPGDPEGSQTAIPYEINPRYQAPIPVYQELCSSESKEGTSSYMTLQKQPDVTEAASDHIGCHGNLKSRDSPLSVGLKRSKPETEDKLAKISGMPSDLSSFSVSDVSQLLKDLCMEKYVPRFQQEMIDGKLLKSLDQNDLESLSMNAFHIKKLTTFLGGWRPKK